MSSVEKNESLISGEAYRLLLQIALLGAEIGDHDAAALISETIKNARPDLPHARAVVAMKNLVSGSKDEALRELEAALEAFPDFQLGRALLGVAMKAGGISGWQSRLEEVIADGRDEFAVGMASEILGRPLDTVAGSPSIGAAPQPSDPAPGNIFWV